MTDGLGLGDAYGATMNRIKGQGGRKAGLGMATLMWVSHAERPLNPDELRHALAVEIGSPSFNNDNTPSIGTFLACCQGLVVVDKEASTVRLIHFTLQEYLRAHTELFGTAHSTIAETCLSYLNSDQVKALPSDSFPDLQRTPFLEYSSLYWGAHAKRDLSDRVKRLALDLFGCSRHISAAILLVDFHFGFYGDGLDRRSRFSGLHWASMFGIVEIVTSLIEVEGCDINEKDWGGNTPFAWAAGNGHEGVVEILLRRDDVSPDIPNGDDLTPLCCAASNGQEGVVKILLGRDDVNPSKPNKWGHTPLFCAAFFGHEGVVKVLLGRGDVSPNKPDKWGQTPLHCASKDGHDAVVKILLGRADVDPNEPDEDGQTPLCCAASNGHEGVVKILLGRGDVDPDKQNAYGQTPLCRAAFNGHEGVAKMLLAQNNVNPNKPDKSGHTPLYCASENGHEGVVKILLEQNNVNSAKRRKLG